MPILRTKTRYSIYAGDVMAVVLLVQPLLDVLSFFMQGVGATAVTTVLRLLLLLAVTAYGFLVTERPQWYGAGCALVGGFWLLHILNCIRSGYAHPLGDMAEFLKLAQFPLWTMAFYEMMKARDSLETEVFTVLTANFGVILLIIGLSYLTFHPVYTYDFPEREVQLGVLGWFAVPNAQSAILSILVPGVMLWGLRTERLSIFTVCSVAGLGLLYATGTRLTYYTALLCIVVFLAILVLCRKPLLLGAPLIVCFVLLLAFKGVSPMQQRQEVGQTSFAVYQEKIDAVMGDDKDFTYHKNEEIPAEVLQKIRILYTRVYGEEGVYGETLLGDLIDRFGVEKVMEEFDYSISPKVLNNTRIRKRIALRMVWEERDFLTHLVGMEYSSATINGHNYDPENDFPALLYFTGYLGVALYVLLLSGIVGYAAWAFYLRYPALMTPEFLTAAMMCALTIGAAQLSGQVLRRPNVTVYFSLAAAVLLTLAKRTPAPYSVRNLYKPNPAVTRFKL